MTYLNLVTDLEQVKQNIKQYNLELQNGEMTLKTNGVQQWYYIHDLGMFGPSRYIGYVNINITKHNNAWELDGGKTTQALSKWFTKCSDQELYNVITEKLIDYLKDLDMDVRRDKDYRKPAFKLNLLKDELSILKELFIR